MTVPSERALVQAAEILARAAGFKPDTSERGRLHRCIQQEAQRRGTSADAYVASLGADHARLQELIDRVTVQETAFFRDPTQFEALARHVLPSLPSGSTVWSAGCANGQEPYSLAILLEEAGDRETRVLATDISTAALERTRQARYTRNEVRGVTRERREQYFRFVDHRYEVRSDLRARVDVAFHNLVTQPPPFARGTCPLILCRNVVIYFGRSELVALLGRFADWMAPGGWLFLGYSESLWHITERFRLVRLGDAFVYQRTGDRERETAARASVDGAASGTRAQPPSARKTARRAPRRDRREADRSEGSRAARPAPAVDGGELLARGEAAASAGDHAAAVHAFRKLAYLFPDQSIAHLRLALALENAGHHDAARRAYRAARGVLERADPAAVQSELEGYHADELARLLTTKLADRP
jgi:chemotaxis protein methyltransferase CheR